MMIERRILFSALAVVFVFGLIIGGLVSYLYITPTPETILIYDACVDPRSFR